MMQWLAIVLLSVLTCVTYGIVHDQITARICVEYFTIGHPPVFDTDDPDFAQSSAPRQLNSKNLARE